MLKTTKSKKNVPQKLEKNLTWMIKTLSWLNSFVISLFLDWIWGI